MPETKHAKGHKQNDGDVTDPGNPKREDDRIIDVDAFLLGAFVFVVLAVFVWFARSTVLPTKRVEKLREAEAEEMMEQG